MDELNPNLELSCKTLFKKNTDIKSGFVESVRRINGKLYISLLLRLIVLSKVIV